MFRRVLRAVVVGVVVLAVAGGGLWLRLRPPALPVPPLVDRAIADVTVVNPGVSRVAHRTVRIERGRVVAVDPFPAANPPKSPLDDRFSGDFALPGLIDMHVHQPPSTPFGDRALFDLLFLAHGVTTVRDTGNMDGSVFADRERVRAGEIAGPRIFACGPLIDGDPPFWPGSRIAADPDQGRAAVREIAARGADCIKVYDRLTPETLAAIQDEAGARRLKVIGHVPERVQFAEARLADVQHLTGVFEPGEKLTPARIRTVTTTSAALGIAHTPTLVLYDHQARLPDYPDAREMQAARVLPRYYREILWAPRNDRRYAVLTEERRSELAGAPAGATEIVRRLRDARVEIHAGTDVGTPFVVPGRSLHEELLLLTEAGLSTEEAWAAATRVPGEFLGESGLGTIAPGAPADLLLFRADPTRDLANLDTLEAVVAGGRLYTRAELDGARARWQAYVDDPLFDRVSMFLAHRLAAGERE